MNRKEINNEEIISAILHVKDMMKHRLDEKGYGTFTSIHEILGIIDEEHDEFRDAVRNNNHQEVIDELTDIAVGAIFGIACIKSKSIDW